MHSLLQSLLRWVSSGWRLAGIWSGVVLYTMVYVNAFTFFQEQAVIGDFYAEGAYVDPKTVTVSGSGKKNLLIIYCESIAISTLFCYNNSRKVVGI